MFIDLKSILNMAPNLRRIFTLRMITIFFNRSTWRPRLKIMIFILQAIHSNIFLKEMCQKPKMDTTIDFVKYPKHSRIKIFLNIFSKNLE